MKTNVILHGGANYHGVLACDFVVSEFEPQSRYYIHFRTNIHEKGLNNLIPFGL